MELFSMIFALLFMALYATALLVRAYASDILGFHRRLLRRFVRQLPTGGASETAEP